MVNIKLLSLIFEKGAAFLFLLLLVGMVLFLVYVPMPTANENVILMIIGALTVSSASALPRLFGVDDSEEDELRKKIDRMQEHIEILEARLETTKRQYDEVVKMLVDDYLKHSKE